MQVVDAYKEINHEITPEVLELFRSKQGNHTVGDHFLLLGARGQFAELNKKFWKLYAAVWEGSVELIGEDVEEVAADMIGHLLLLIYSVRRDREAEGVPSPHEDGIEPMSAQLSAQSSHESGERPGGIQLPPRCLLCADCLDNDPAWCRAWGPPNEYTVSFMTEEQAERVARMFER